MKIIRLENGQFATINDVERELGSLISYYIGVDACELFEDYIDELKDEINDYKRRYEDLLCE